MPYHGLIPFLHDADEFVAIDEIEGFNALPRAHPISTQQFILWHEVGHIVSMPYHGLIPFLLPPAPMVSGSGYVVSMPYHGLIPFLQKDSGRKLMSYIRFNALPRAHPISTVHGPMATGIAISFQCPTTGSSHFYCCY